MWCRDDTASESLNSNRGRRRQRPQRYTHTKCCGTAIVALMALALSASTPLSSCFLLHPRQQKHSVRNAGRSSSSASVTRPDSRSHATTRLFYANSTSPELSLTISKVSHSSLTETSGRTSNHHQQNRFKVYCDMDGVLVDFEKGVYNLLQTGTSNLDKHTMWSNIARIPHWFEQLEWKQDGRRLWRAIKHLQPDILTGVPNIQTSCIDKYNWCKRELQLQDAHHVDMAADGKHCAHKSINGNRPREDATNVITCWSLNKHRECRRGS
jgi:hypothetical protein